MLKGCCKLGLVLFIVLLMCTSYSYAFGISTPYIENNTLILHSGDHYIYEFLVQNGDNNDYFVNINYSSTNNIAIMPETNRFLLKQTYDNRFVIQILVPENANKGDLYTISYSARPQFGESGAISMGVELQHQFFIEIIVDEPDKKRGFKNFIKSLGLIILLILSIVFTSVLLWRTSHKLSKVLIIRKKNKQTIRQITNIKQMIYLLKRMKNVEFELEEIKKLIGERLKHLDIHMSENELHHVRRSELIKKLKEKVKNKI